ncbi:NACHT, LRR and PYD domains-containing protein 1b allele 3-like [Esox lucius]|uniref:NACHT, LRR and PYD domains-containing protein 1b allele 3-like n=1 Tax=Esox lucius TaxID=8010 RepID=UPI001476BD64|nr:NACHT, LRR and PYD domains-containing protein 1b allele 3-like [Esox lucius]
MAAMNIIEEVQFVDRHRSALIQRVTLPILIADDLLGQGMISGELYSQIFAATTSQEKMRILYEGLHTGGSEVKSAFYESLRRNDPHLVNDLEH